jgi:hypothetical protein
MINDYDKEDERGRASSGENRKHTGFWWESHWERDYSEDLHIGGIILK